MVDRIDDAEVQRNEHGHFLPGNTANPNGINGHSKGWTPYELRVRTLAEKYSTEQILAYARDDELRAKDLSYWDGLCIVHMARAQFRGLTVTDSGADHVNKERECLLDRLEGKAKETLEHQGPDGQPLTIGGKLLVELVDANPSAAADANTDT